MSVSLSGEADLLTAYAGEESFSTTLLDRARMAHDASHYLLTPSAVVTARGLDHVASVLRGATKNGVPVTFRSGGTSLSGQASTDGVLVDVRRHGASVEVLEEGRLVRCGAGTVLRRVNAALAPYRRRLGPDPASESACTIGGVVANNASGMTSGIAATSYWTLESLVLVLPSGTVLDTGAADADQKLREVEPALYRGLVEIRDFLRERADLSDKIRHQFSMKNTMGYALCAFLDFTSPVDILEHLAVGSEGTLAYIHEVTLRTLPAEPYAATALCVFDGIDAATEAIIPFTQAGANAVELLDSASLRVSQHAPDAPEALSKLEVNNQTALLVEVQRDTQGALQEASFGLEAVIGQYALAAPATLVTDASERNRLWTARRVLYAAVAGSRPQGTTALLEDIVVPPSRLPDTVSQLQRILGEYGYDDAVIFGHAKDANLHFQINPDLQDEDSLKAYEDFTEELVDLILGADGSLKAEHGAGRMMSPYVRRQFGDELYTVMQKIKALCDPATVLAPGVILNDDPKAHLKDLKVYPPVSDQVDRCVECGYCEPVCPSRNTTTTPRQRIALLREMQSRSGPEKAELEREFTYAGVQTCAADSLCYLACPLQVDTGKVMKEMRAAGRSGLTQTLGDTVADHWGATTALLRTALKVTDVLPGKLLETASSAARVLTGEVGRDWIPQVDGFLPGPGEKRSTLFGQAGDFTRIEPTTDAVFYPACIGSLFEGAEDRSGAMGAFARLVSRAGLTVASPKNTDSLCCGTVWESKGLTAGAETMAEKNAQAIFSLMGNLNLPLVCDASSCTHGLKTIGKRLAGHLKDRWDDLEIVDAVSFVRTHVLPRLDIPEERKVDTVLVHPTCSAVHLDIVEDLKAVAAACANRVVVPETWGCCGTAGDRGMLHPELTQGATESEAHEIATLEADGEEVDAYVSCNRTCEMGMTKATGHQYEHVLELLERITRPAASVV